MKEQGEEKSISCKGYVVKIHKRLISNGNYLSYSPAEQGNKGNKQLFDFICWMNFDGIRVKEIDDFMDFRSFTAEKPPLNVDVFTERQKILLYDLPSQPSKDILSKDPKYDNYPLIVVTLISLPTIDKSCDSAEKIANVLSAEATWKKTFQFQVMGTLSSCDCAIVFRGNCYQDIFDSIHELRNRFRPTYTYSISGFDPSNIDNWQSDKGFAISIRMMLPTSISPRGMKAILKDTKTLNSLQLFYTFGKFDIEMRGKLRDPSGFAKLYNKGILDAFFDNNSYGFLSTNTRLTYLNQEKIDPNDLGNYRDNLSKQYANDSSEVSQMQSKQMALIDKCCKISQSTEVSVSQIIISALFQLIMRRGQAELSLHTQGTCPDVLKAIDTFLDLTFKSLEKGENIADISEGISSLNTLLDNRISASYRDFEAPNANLRFTGAGSKMLLAFTNFVNQVLTAIRPAGSNTITFLPYLTIVDAQTRIISSLLFYNSEVSLVNISIPIDMLFDIKYSFCLLLHEIGHLDCFTWDREEYICDVINNILLHIVADYLKSEKGISADSRAQQVSAWIEELTKRHKFPIENLSDQIDSFHRDSTLSFAEIKRVVVPYFLSVVAMCSSEFENDKAPYQLARIVQDYVEETFDLYLEGIADAFMCELLQFADVKSYIELFAHYFDLVNVNISSLQSNILLRIICVAMLILSSQTGETDFSKTQRKLRDKIVELCDESTSLGLLCSQLNVFLEKSTSESTSLYCAKCLFSYLQKQVVPEIQSSLSQPQAKKLVEIIRDFNTRFSGGTCGFADCVDFIEQFK